MFFTILIVIICLIALLSLHEVGHFLFAKKFGVKVEEFGIGYPPRVWGKRWGETVYSFNLLPFGAFVRIASAGEGEEENRGFAKKAIWQRALVLLGGILAFWVLAVCIFTFAVGVGGMPSAVPDDYEKPGVLPWVQIIAVSPNSPAEVGGLKVGDEIIQLKIRNDASLKLKINKMKEVQQFIGENAGQEIALLVKRGDEEIEIFLVPRVNPPSGEGAAGVALVRAANLKTAWFKSPIVGAKITFSYTKAIPALMFDALIRKLKGERITDIQFMGPIGAGQMMTQALQASIGSFLMLLGALSVWLALFNLLPVPSLDGGQLLFLAIEAVKKKPVRRKVEQRITAVCFCLLLLLMAFITVQDILRLF